MSGDVETGETHSAPETQAASAARTEDAASTVRAARQDGIKILISNFWIWPALAGLVLTTAVALILGFQDVVWPVSLSAQIVGLFFLIAVLFGLIGIWLLARRALPLRRRPATTGVALAFISGGAVACLYVDLTIVAYAFRYQPRVAIAFAVLGLVCLCLAWRTLPPSWSSLSKTVKSAGITLAALGTLANFWYQSIYLPENSQVGIEYAVSLGPVVNSGGGSRLVTIDLTMDNESPVTALTLGSMVVVTGLEYTSSGRQGAISSKAAQERAAAYAASLAERPSKSAAIPNPNIEFTGSLKTTTLTILRPIDNDSYLFPDDEYAREFDVVIPNKQIVALQVKLYVLSARTTRLSLGSRLVSAPKNLDTCSNDEQSGWYVNESALVRFTRGAQILYSDWCADLGDPYITWDVATPPGTHDSPGAENSIGANIDVINSSRDDIFVLN